MGCKNEEMALTRKEEPNREIVAERDESISRIKVLSKMFCSPEHFSSYAIQ